MKDKMLIKDIEPIDKCGINLLQEEDKQSIIERIIELPLREACKIFAKKGIQTVMSSANKNNILKQGEKPTEKEDVKGKQFFFPSPTFKDAGKGYAWIMLDFKSLSDDNKDLLFSLEERKDRDGRKIGEKAIWFVHPSIMGGIDYQIKTGKCTYEDLRMTQEKDECTIPENIEIDTRLAEFEKRHIVLSYNNMYPTETVILRMPINDQTTVEEVEEYFSKFAEAFKSQVVQNKEDELNIEVEDDKQI